ncbi:MAG: aminopeptidase, partial [Gammaproteobacteria bacterium]|nr:aminopeptidase [Gammaproteobacteria bacterium]
FASLLSGHDRALWTVAGARLLNHPLRAAETLGYVEPGLEFASALRRRGEIFLPRQWLEALLGGHGSTTAAEIIHAFLDAQDHPARLRQLLLQTADPVFRAARIRGSL